MDDNSPEVSNLPFKVADKLVGESAHKTVSGYESGGLVVKTPKAGHRETFSNWEQAAAEIQENQRSRQRVQEIMSNMQASKDIIPSSEAVIHQKDGGVGFSETQSWYKDSPPLANLKGNLSGLSREALLDLKKIFQADLKLWKEDKTFLDINGSNNRNPNPFVKILRNLLPLYFSENIILSPDGKPKLIDVESISRHSQYFDKSLKGRIRTAIRLAGSYISIGIINLNLAMRGKEKTEFKS